MAGFVSPFNDSNMWLKRGRADEGACSGEDNGLATAIPFLFCSVASTGVTGGGGLGVGVIGKAVSSSQLCAVSQSVCSPS